jgi:hypothetical protein
MNERIQARLLLAILQRRWSDAERVARETAREPSTFVGVCNECDVPSLVHSLLHEERRADLVGDESMALLAKIRSRVQRDNLLLLARAEQSLDALLEAGVVPVLLKGLDLIHRIYERFDERTLDDVDLLVEQRQLPAALAALEAAGWEAPPEPARTHYIRSSHHLPLKSPGPVTVDFELHWNLAQEQRFHVDPEGIVRRAVPCDIAGRRVLRMEDHDLVAHLLLHHFTHYFDRRLKWAVDLQRIAAAPDFRWAVVAERIRSWGATAVSGMSLLHLSKTMPDCIPGEILELLPVDGWRRLATWPLRSGHPLELFRGARNRGVQLYLAAVLLEQPSQLPGWIRHRRERDLRPGGNPLDNGGPSGAGSGGSGDGQSPERKP